MLRTRPVHVLLFPSVLTCTSSTAPLRSTLCGFPWSLQSTSSFVTRSPVLSGRLTAVWLCRNPGRLDSRPEVLCLGGCPCTKTTLVDVPGQPACLGRGQALLAVSPSLVDNGPFHVRAEEAKQIIPPPPVLLPPPPCPALCRERVSCPVSHPRTAEGASGWGQRGLDPKQGSRAGSAGTEGSTVWGWDR